MTTATTNEPQDTDDGVYMRSASYRPIKHLMAGISSAPIRFGTAGVCRFCGTTDPKLFKKDAHTLPELLGNKWIFSLDECDDCNNKFSRYEGALAASVGPFLTFGGVKGKRNDVRQTGRTAGPTYVEHTISDGRRSLSAMVNGLGVQLGCNERTGSMVFTWPIWNERFRPLDAHKALLKVGYALLSDDERREYESVRQTLCNPSLPVGDPPQAVGLSFAMFGNAPALVSATLVRRSDERLPRTLVIITAGSVCLITELRSDVDERPSIPLSKIGTRWTTHVRSPRDDDAISIEYSPSIYFDWSSTNTTVQPIESVTLEFDPSTTQSSFTPTFRDSSPFLTNDD